MQTDMSQNPNQTGSPASGDSSQDQSIANTAPGQLRVIKRNGKVVGYDDDKITVAISKAFLAVEGGTAAASSRIHETVARLTEQVTATFKRRMPSGGTIHIEEIQDQVELALMRNGEQKVARDYVLYRERQAAKRAEQASTDLPELPVLLMCTSEPDFDETAKASHFGASVVIGELADRRVMAHVLTLLRRFAGAAGARSHGRVVPGEADELGFLCTHPTRLALMACDVLDISPRGVSFSPYDIKLASELREGTAIDGCSLRLGGRIVDLACTVRRSSLEDSEPSLGLEFDHLPDEVAELIRDYLEARPERELARRLEGD